MRIVVALDDRPKSNGLLQSKLIFYSCRYRPKRMDLDSWWRLSSTNICIHIYICLVELFGWREEEIIEMGFLFFFSSSFPR